MAKRLEPQIEAACVWPHNSSQDMDELGVITSPHDSGFISAYEAFTESGYPQNLGKTYFWEGPNTRRCFRGGRELWCKDVETSARKNHTGGRRNAV